jgi:hypothetical protein
MTNLKIAVWLTGKICPFKDHNPPGNQVDNLLEPNKADVFVCTEPHRQLSSYLKRYEPYLIDKKVYKQETNIDMKGFERGVIQYRKVAECYEMMVNSGVQYDLILRVRMDTIFSELMSLRKVDLTNDQIMLFAGKEKNRGYVCTSGFAIGKQKAMQIYSELGDWYTRYRSKSGTEFYFDKMCRDLESQMLLHVHYNNLTVIPVNHIYPDLKINYLLRMKRSKRARDFGRGYWLIEDKIEKLADINLGEKFFKNSPLPRRPYKNRRRRKYT